MKPPPFAYHRPTTRAAVDRLLAELGEEAKVLAGGQSLLPIMNMRLAAPAHLVDINGLEDEPAAPVVDDGVVRFGPLVRQAAVERWPELATHAPALGEAIAYTAHPAIRSRGTVVGSIAHADPAAELPALLLALDGEVRARSADGARTIAARDFFLGALETSLRPGEWLEEASLPVLPAGTGYAVEEFAQRHGDYALCGVVAVARRRDSGDVDVRLVHFGIGALAVRSELPAYDSAEAIREALAGVEMTDDLHATAPYRRHLAEALGARAAGRAAGMARG
jgi:aerobic carbon-monoxide dehydrogenase medium subunit